MLNRRKRIFCSETNPLKLKNFTRALLIVLSLQGNGVFACAVDVTINEGAQLEMCANSPLSVTAAPGFVSYDWSGPETLSGQTITPQFSGTYTVTAVDGVGCISTASIDVTIHANPVPVILSSEGNPLCPSASGTTLSTSISYTAYDWGAGNSGPTFFAAGTGAYALTVTDQFGCTGHEVITLTQYNFTLTSTPFDGCFGTGTILTAAGGSTYLWSTGETGSSIVVSPGTTTTYTVTVTNNSCSEDLSADVAAMIPVNYDLPDTVYMSADESSQFAGPSGAFSYNWYPAEHVDFPNAQEISVSSDSSFTLYMEATHTSGCVIVDSVVIIVVNLDIPNGFSPNGDGYNDLFIVGQLYALDGNLTVWNRWGDVVFESEHYQNDWDGTCKTSLCMGSGVLPEGTYFYTLTVEEIRYTGYITLKL